MSTQMDLCGQFIQSLAALVSIHSFYGYPLWGAPAWPHAQPLMLQGVPSPAWTSPCATIPSEVYLLWHRHNHTHRHFKMHLLWQGLIHSHRHFGVSCSHVDSSTGHSPFDLSSHWSSNLSSTATQKQQWCPGHLSAQAQCHCCDQNVPRCSSTAVQTAAKAKSRH